jgi:glycosyltransferase involved in cell wall biosynthesis
MSVVLEGMYYNGTVVTTINNGNEEFIVNNESGYLIEANNQDQITEIITRLYNDPMFIEKTKIKAKQLVQDCSWKNYCENFNEICLSVIREFEMSNEA